MSDSIPPDLELHPGDVLSYSAGSTQCGPTGYRRIRPRPSLFATAVRRWPDLGQVLGGRTPMIINAYPAAIGALAAGITVDTYLSPRVLSRALQLAAHTRAPTALAGQPLFLADALRQHVDAERPLPETLLLMVGGYATPRSLERWLRSTLVAAGAERVLVLQGYGAAEVDAGCMMARERDEAGRLVYYPRQDVEPSLDGDALLLTMRGADGEVVIDRFATGERAERTADGGWVLWNHERLHPAVLEALESWSDEGWYRRTGYVRRDGDALWIQLRAGEEPTTEHELDHWDFGRRFGFSWLDKPYWR